LPSRLMTLAWVVALLGVVAVGAGFGLSMYFIFSTVGADDINGVEGRYYLIPLLIALTTGLYGIKRRWGTVWQRPQLALLASIGGAVTILASNGIALSRVWSYFYNRI